AIDRDTVAVLLDEVLIAIVLHELRNAIHREIPGHALELVGTRLAVHRVLNAGLRLDVAERTGALRAQRSAIHRIVHVTLDMGDFHLALLGLALSRINHHAAADRTIRARAAGFLRLRESKWPD